MRWLRTASLDPKLVACTGTFSDMHAIYDATTALMERDNTFTAIFAIADVMAIAAIKALSDRGMHVPDDCSVVAIVRAGAFSVHAADAHDAGAAGREIGLACAKTIIELIDAPEETGSSRLPPRSVPGGL
jgi:DNA-binding LacI/PurR family transcriptional regulator